MILTVRRPTFATLLFGLGVAVVVPAESQNRRGLTVRVTTGEPGGAVVGVLRGIGDSVLTVDSVAIPLSAVRRVEVYRGIGGHAGAGALIGAAVGLVGGFVIGSNTEGSAGVSQGTLGAMIATPILALFGCAVGAIAPPARWSVVPLEDLRPSGTARAWRPVRLGVVFAF